MQLINNLLEKISTFSLDSPMLLWLFLVFLMYGGMFLIALIGESRILSFWKYQSRVFFPGDLLLCFASMMAFHDWYFLEKEVSYATKNSSIIIGIACSLYLFIFGRKNDASNYSKRARYSPTKLYHDILGYLIFGFIVFARLIPGIFIIGLGYGVDIFARVFTLYLIFMGPYCILALLDIGTNPDEEVLEKRHPSDWAPIWKTKKILK